MCRRVGLITKDEVPIVLNELNDSAIRYIAREQYEKALILLQKAHGIINVVSLDKCARDKYFAFVVFHNMAACYQRMSSLEDCAVALEDALRNIGDYSSLSDRSIAQRMNLMQKECKIRMQLCALLSQLHKHKDALKQARKSVSMIHLLIKDLKTLCCYYIRKQEAKEEAKEDQDLSSTGSIDAQGSHFHNYSLYSPTSMAAAAYNNLESPLSMVEKTARRILPVIHEVQKVLIKEKESEEKDDVLEKEQQEVRAEEDQLAERMADQYKPDMRTVLGYLNQSEWIQNINIGNIM